MAKVDPKMESSDAPPDKRVKADNCAAPANTNKDIACACQALRPNSIANAPVSTPQGTQAIANGRVASIALRQSSRSLARSELSRDMRFT